MMSFQRYQRPRGVAIGRWLLLLHMLPNQLLKGYVPVTTYSAHWISDPEFRNAIENFVLEEGEHVQDVVREGMDRSAFKPEPGGPGKTPG